MNSIYVRHNAEIAHRLSNLPGKCQNIHGHSLMITIKFSGIDLDPNGIFGSADFGAIKKKFRTYIDETWDHHLHLNKLDPWAVPCYTAKTVGDVGQEGQILPGLVMWPADPTTENMARWIWDWSWYNMIDLFNEPPKIHVSIQETGTNGAEYGEVG